MTANLSVSEPWNFNSPDGQNIVKGRILKKISDSCLIFEANYILEFSKGTGNIFILTPRHSEKNFSKFPMAGEYISLNCSLPEVEFSNSMTETELRKNPRLVIIGDLTI